MTVQIIRQWWDPKLQVDCVDYAGLAAERTTVSILTEGSSYYASDTKATYISGALGWTVKPAAAAQSVAVASALPAGTNNIGKVTLEGEIPAGTKVIGGVTFPGTVQADIAAMKADIALIKAQNQTAKPASHSFVFDEDDLVKTAAIAYNGLVKHVHLVVPNFTNVVTATVTLVDASGRVLWTSAAKAKNASYNLEAEIEWLDQLTDNTIIWTITLSGAAGGTGGTVVLIPRYYGV